MAFHYGKHRFWNFRFLEYRIMDKIFFMPLTNIQTISLKIFQFWNLGQEMDISRRAGNGNPGGLLGMRVKKVLNVGIMIIRIITCNN